MIFDIFQYIYIFNMRFCSLSSIFIDLVSNSEGGYAYNPTNTARKYTVYELKGFEIDPLNYCKGDGKVIFTRPFLMLSKVTFDEDVNVLEIYHKGDISYTFTEP